MLEIEGKIFLKIIKWLDAFGQLNIMPDESETCVFSISEDRIGMVWLNNINFDGLPEDGLGLELRWMKTYLKKLRYDILIDIIEKKNRYYWRIREKNPSNVVVNSWEFPAITAVSDKLDPNKFTYPENRILKLVIHGFKEFKGIVDNLEKFEEMVFECDSANETIKLSAEDDLALIRYEVDLREEETVTEFSLPESGFITRYRIAPFRNYVSKVLSFANEPLVIEIMKDRPMRVYGTIGAINPPEIKFMIFIAPVVEGIA